MVVVGSFVRFPFAALEVSCGKEVRINIETWLFVEKVGRRGVL